MLPVGLPFFVDATIADDYLASDRPVIRLRAFGSAIHAGASRRLHGELLRPSGWRPRRFAGPPSRMSRCRFRGYRSAARRSRSGPGRTPRTVLPLMDELVRTFGVVRSRLAANSVALCGRSRPISARRAVRTSRPYTFSDAGRGQYVSLLEALAVVDGARVDQALARAIAHDLLVAEFGYDPASLPPGTFDRAVYPIGQQEN